MNAGYKANLQAQIIMTKYIEPMIDALDIGSSGKVIPNPTIIKTVINISFPRAFSVLTVRSNRH